MLTGSVLVWSVIRDVNEALIAITDIGLCPFIPGSFHFVHSEIILDA